MHMSIHFIKKRENISYICHSFHFQSEIVAKLKFCDFCTKFRKYVKDHFYRVYSHKLDFLRIFKNRK